MFSSRFPFPTQLRWQPRPPQPSRETQARTGLWPSLAEGAAGKLHSASSCRRAGGRPLLPRRPQGAEPRGPVGPDLEPGGHLECRAPPGSGPALAPPLYRLRPSLLGPLRRSICIRRRLPAPPSEHVTLGRRREPADLTRAVLRLPLARNSKSSRDLRPRPPAANKSAGRLQTQNFHVGKSQDGRERSGAPTGSLAQRPGA